MRKMFSQRSLFSQPYQITGTVYPNSSSTRVIEIWALKGSESSPKIRVTTRGAYNRISFTLPIPSAGEWSLQFKAISGAYPVTFTFNINGYSRSWIPRAVNNGVGGLYFFNFGELPKAESEAVPKSTKPRYRVISPPNQNGTQTESIRELTAIQLESFKNRGYDVQQVDGSIPLQNPIVLGHKARRPTVPTVRRERTSVPSGMIVKPNWVPIGGRRKRSHGRLVSMPTHYNFRRLGQNGIVLDYIGAPQSVLDYFRNNNYNLYNIRTTSDTSNRTVQVTGRDASRWKKGKTVFKSSTSSGGSSSASSGGSSGDTSQEANRLEGELRTLTSQIREINERTSQQLIQLGQSTVDRDNQIQQLDRWTQEQLTRIDQSLVALGNAQKDASAGIDASAQATLAAVQQQIDALKASIESASKSGGSSILGGLFNTSNLPIILILVVVLLVMIRK